MRAPAPACSLARALRALAGGLSKERLGRLALLGNASEILPKTLPEASQNPLKTFETLRVYRRPGSKGKRSAFRHASDALPVIRRPPWGGESGVGADRLPPLDSPFRG